MGAPTKFLKVRNSQNTQQSRVQDNVDAVLTPIAQSLQGTPLMGSPPPKWIEPDFADVNWSNWLLAGTTSPYQGVTAKCAYHKDALGYVHFKGLIKTTVARPTAMRLFTLPSGYAPKEIQIHIGYTTHNNADVWAFLIYPSGAIVAQAGLLKDDIIGMSQIMFLAEGGGTGGLAGGLGGGGGISPHG